MRLIRLGWVGYRAGLSSLEEVAQRATSWWIVGEALQRVSDEELYKSARYNSFRQYFSDTRTMKIWGFGRSRAIDLMANVNLLKLLPPETSVPESVIREFRRAKVQEIPTLWARCCELANNSEWYPGEVTNEIARQVVGERPEDRNNTNHIWYSSATDKWYMNDELIIASRTVLGKIHLDSASDEVAAERVQADEYISKVQDGLEVNWSVSEGHELHGQPIKVLCNAPFGQHRQKRTAEGSTSMQGLFLEKAIKEFHAGRVHSVLLHLRAGIGHVWFDQVFNWPHCFLKRHIRFINPKRPKNTLSSCHGSVFVLLTRDNEVYYRFLEVFGTIGRIPGYNGTYSHHD